MAKIEELFGAGDLLGVEVSIDSLTGEIVIYSDQLTLNQSSRIEKALGEVTYQSEIPGPNGDDPSPESMTTVTAAADGFVWTVIAVDFGDTLSVRAESNPEASIVAQLDPWATSFVVSSDVATKETGTWRQVQLDSGHIGWVNARFLVAQPATLTDEDRQTMIDHTESLVAWALQDSSEPNRWLSDRALWVGGIGVYADGPTPWTWIPAPDLQRSLDLRAIRHFGFGDDFECDECDKSLLDFLHLERLDETTETLVDDIGPANARGFVDGQLWLAPESLHRVVLDKPSSTFVDDNGNTQQFLDWQRIHFVFDWSTGGPQVALIHTHGQVP